MLVQDMAVLNVVDLTAVKIVAPVKRLQTKTQVNTRTLHLILCVSFCSASMHCLLVAGFSANCWYLSYSYTHNRFMAVFRDYPGEPMPEEIFFWTL